MNLSELYCEQVANQMRMLRAGVYDGFKANTTNYPITDDVGIFSYQIQQLMSEIGEVLEADKRWKSHRNSRYNFQQKVSEIADCFIVMMNIAMFSGIPVDVLEEAIEKKIALVKKRIEAEKNERKNSNETESE